MTDGDQSRDHPGDEMVRLTVAEAARRLGISEAGVRKRIQRGQIPYERGDDRRVWVWISPSEVRDAEDRDESAQSRDRDKMSRDEPLEDLRDQVRYLRDQLDRADERDRENRRIIAALTSRIPELPAASAPPEPRESPESPADEQQGRGPVPDARGPQEGAERVPWWRRVFGG
jgi:excisionase family DNA binding protein